MPDIIERTPLQIALTQACEFAVAHGVEGPITPDDFGIQRSSAGWQHATYVDASHAVSVTIDPDGIATFGVAELNWTHWPDTELHDDEDCGICHPPGAASTHFRGLPLTDVHLPGDAPDEAVSARG